jgi:Zn2+/Cd2+-exporting ATPase
MTGQPYLFDEFFASGREESISPFLTPSSRRWGKNLSLKSAIASSILLAIAYLTSFFHETLTYLFLIPVYVFAGTPALIDSIEDIKNWEINIDVLMTLAAFLSVLIGSEIEGALLLVLFELSGAMENTVVRKTKTALVNLYHLSPKIAHVVGEDGMLLQRSVKDVGLDTLILIRAGEVVPLDGIVVEGSSFVNLVHLTGESHPIPKKISNEVPAGALNLEGTLTLKVTRTSGDSTLTRIIKLITHAQESKPRLEQLLDRFGKKYALTIIILFFIFALSLPLIFSIPYLGVEGSVYRALTFLIAASPCALIIATPTAYLSAISSCAKRGILLKGGIVFDALTSCRLIAFDKTGTLTTGKLTCSQVEPLQNKETYDLNTILGIAASLERHAVHPIAEAIVAHAVLKKAPLVTIDGFKLVPGFGVEGRVLLNNQSVPVFIGNPEYIASKTTLPITIQETLLLIDNSLFAFHFIDSVRPEMRKTLEQLKTEKKMRLLMLTGDHQENAKRVAEEVGLDEVYADMRPEDKLKKVEELSENQGLIMIGDGINDAPALARATVGIALGKIGSATAADAADVVLLHDDLTLLYWLISKSQKTLSIIKENLFLALGVILFATTPALLGFIPLWLAVILHEGGTVLVGLNSLRLLRK